MKSSEQIVKEINDRIADNKALMIEHDNDENAVHELQSAINELENLLEWIYD